MRLFEVRSRMTRTGLILTLPQVVARRLRLREEQSVFLLDNGDGTFLLTIDDSFPLKMLAEDILGRYRRALRFLSQSD